MSRRRGNVIPGMVTTNYRQTSFTLKMCLIKYILHVMQKMYAPIQ